MERRTEGTDGGMRREGYKKGKGRRKGGGRFPKLAWHTHKHIQAEEKRRRQGFSTTDSSTVKPSFRGRRGRDGGDGGDRRTEGGGGDQLRSTVHSLHQHRRVASLTQITSSIIGISK